MTVTRRKPTVPLARTTLRVAVYCRQSVEDAVSEFGSIQAQREAVHAYIASQRVHGWEAIDTQYEDGGFSGKNTDRPAFQRLLADVDARNVDIVAVYKLDRLSRSLSDFVALMARFREHDVEFVSITQNFSTTTSVGRLTLNMLASFAEFEREQISERTSDKMRASRRKGFWTGGPVPLGYELIERKLVVNANEAEEVRWLFDTYLSLRSIARTIDAANARGLRLKSWTTKEGSAVHGQPFNKTTLGRLLTNPLYIGMHRACDEEVKGQQEAIVATELFEAVGAQLRANHNNGGASTKNRYGALLRNLVTCAVCGSSMNHTIGGSGRYYACARLLKESATACPGSRVPVALIETAVVERLRAIGRDPRLVDATLAAAHDEYVARLPAKESDAERIDRQIAQKERERTNLVRSIAQGALTADIEQVEADLASLEATRIEVPDELALLRTRQVDEDEVRRVLRDFDPLWNAMLVHEREAVLRVLVSELTYDGRTGEVALNGSRFRLPIRKSRPQPPRRPRNAPRRGIRGARMLALTHVVEREIERGTIRDLGHAAQLFGISRARMTQVAQLAALAPDLQERLLAGDKNIHERALRAALRSVDWTKQRAAIEELK